MSKEWLNKPIRNVHITVREPDIIELDVQRFVRELREMRCNFMTFLTAGYHAIYPSKIPLNRVNPYLGDRDICKELVEECHKYDIKVGTCIDVAAVPRPVYEQHPEWFKRDPEGNAFICNTFPAEQYIACPIGGYIPDFILPVVKEQLDNYDFDHLNLTAFGFGGYGSGHCCCHVCRTGFRQETGHDIPAAADFNNPVWVEYLNWRADELVKAYRETLTKIKEMKPGIATWINQAYDITSTPYPRPGLEELSEFEELVKSEAQSKILFADIDEGVALPPMTYPGEQGRYFNTLSEKQVLTTTSYYLGWPWRRTAVPGVMQKMWIAEGAANGVSPFVHIGGFPANQEDRRGLQPVTEIFNFLADNERYYDGMESYVNVALVLSQNTINHFAGNKLETNYTQHFRGAYAALAESHIPFDIISERYLSLERLAKYKVLVLPNMAVMSTETADALRQYVRGGGNLIGSFETSLLDEKGQQRADYALADVFGCDITGRKIGPLASRKRGQRVIMSYLLRHEEHPILEGLGDTDVILNAGYAWLVAAKSGARVPLTIQLPYDVFPEGEAWTPTKMTDIPGAVVNEFGQGKVVFFPGMFDRMYQLFGHPDHRVVLGNATRWMLGNDDLIRMEAPLTVDVMLQGQEAEGRVTAHLINLTGKRLQTEVIPLFELKLSVKLPGGAAAKAVRLASTGESLPFETKDGRVSVTVPKLDIYDIVAFETK